MKYCTNCGAALEDSTASFCAECGKPLSSGSGDSVMNTVENKKAKHKETKKKKPKKEKIRKQKKTKKKDEVLEEIVGEPVDDGYDGYYEKGQKQRETAYNNFLTVVNTFRKKFHSFAPNSQDEYHNTIAQMIETILPAWMSYRNTFVCL